VSDSPRTAPTLPAAKPPVPAATTGRVVLPNGLVLLVRENHANPTIALHGLVKAGAIFDPPGRSGLATFVAAMLDQGTASRTAFEQASAVENLGASLRFEGGLETVSIQGNMLSGDLEAVLTALADALRNPIFPPEPIEQVRGELLNEYRIAESSTSSVAARRANELLYPEDHPYHYPAAGTEAALLAITRGELASFHSNHYGPDRTILVLVGDVTLSRAAALATAAFGSWLPVPDAPPFQVAIVPSPEAPRTMMVPRPGKSQTDVVYALPGVARTASDFNAAMMMNYVLGGASLSSRLMDSLRDREGLVYGVYSGMMAGIGAGPLQIRAGTNPANATRAIEAIVEEVSKLHDEGPTEREMEEAKGYLTGVFPVRLETNAGVAGQVLTAELYGLGLDYIERYPSIIGAVTREETHAAARSYLSTRAYALVTAGPMEESGGSGAR
jgi:zinc protease